jgi:hypothetical protein
MYEMVTIVSEVNNSCRRINIYIPATAGEGSRACIQDRQGTVLKKLSLQAGFNSIDLNDITASPIIIKVETPHEMTLKEINPF